MADDHAIPAAERLCAGRCGRCDHHVGGAEGHAFIPCQHCEIPQYRSDDCWTGSQNRHQYSHGQSAEYGADCIADCAGAYYEYGGPILVADFGTATTFNYVTADASVICGLITTGIRTGAAALWDATAQLPEVEITRPSSILAKSTSQPCSRPVLQLPWRHRTYDAQFHREIDEDFRVVATGGLSRVFADDTDMIDIYDPDLIFKGMLHIYERNIRQ